MTPVPTSANLTTSNNNNSPFPVTPPSPNLAPPPPITAASLNFPTVPGYKNTNVMTAWTTSGYAQCPNTAVPNLCVLSDANTAKSVCDSNPKCVGFWVKFDVNWIKNDGTLYYQLIEDLSTTMTKIPDVLYTK